MTIMMTKPFDYYDDTDDENSHKNDHYTAASAAPGAIVPYSLFLHHLNQNSQNKTKQNKQNTYHIDIILIYHRPME